MKALKLQCCDAGKPSKAISSNRAARPLPIRLINRASHRKAPRLLRGNARAKSPTRRIAAPNRVFRQAGFAVPKPHNIAPACGAAGRGPPFLMATMGLLILLIASAMAQPGAPAAITDGIVADYAFSGHVVLPGGAPAVGDTVWVVNQARTDSLGVVTDLDGRYENDPLTSVPDAYRQGASLRAFPNPDPRTLILESPDKSGGAKMKLYDVRGREVTDDQRIPAGAYIARATTPSGENATVKVVFSQSAEPDKLTLEQRISDITTAQAQKSPSQALDATVKVNKQEYQPVNEPVTLQPQGTIIEDITLEANGHVLAHGRTGDEIGNLLTNGGSWKFTDTSSNEHYHAPLDSEGYWSVSIPDTIPPDRVFNVEFTDNTDVRPRTHTFLKLETPTNGPMNDSPKLYCAYDVYGYDVNLGELTKETLTRPAGLLALTFRQSSADDNTILELIREGTVNGGVREWGLDYRKLYNKLDNYPQGNYIGDARRAMHEMVLDFIETIDHLPGHLAQPYFSSTERYAEFGYPDDPYGWVAIEEVNNAGPGNIRGPPGEPFMTYVLGWTPSYDVTSTLALEILEALGANDDSSGSNGMALMYNDQSELQLTTRGEVVMSVANTYKTGAFRMTQ